MSENIKINVNGNQIESAPNKLLIEACEDSGIHIPRFCWHKRLDPVGTNIFPLGVSISTRPCWNVQDVSSRNRNSKRKNVSSIMYN